MQANATILLIHKMLKVVLKMLNKNSEKMKISKIGIKQLNYVNVFSREFNYFILTSLTSKNNSYISYERRNLL